MFCAALRLLFGTGADIWFHYLFCYLGLCVSIFKWTLLLLDSDKFPLFVISGKNLTGFLVLFCLRYEISQCIKLWQHEFLQTPTPLWLLIAAWKCHFTPIQISKRKTERFVWSMPWSVATIVSIHSAQGPALQSTLSTEPVKEPLQKWRQRRAFHTCHQL